MRNAFVALTGEYENIGDGLIRRVALDWVRCENGVNAFLGDAPVSWIQQMQLGSVDRVTTGGWNAFARWLWSAVFSRRRPVLVTEPGEMSLARRNLPRQFAVMLAALGVRARGGSVVLPPRAVTRRPEALPWRPTLLIHRATCRLATICMWRDEWSLKLVGVGDLVPDTGFAGNLRDGSEYVNRRKLVISLRGSRPRPSVAWFEGIKQFAERQGLEIETLAQVKGDDTRAREVAKELGGAHFPWTDDGIDREHALRAVYDETAVVISDRLHVLIIAALSGAVPAEVVVSPSKKVEAHFATIGLDAVSLDCDGLSAEDIARWLTNQSARHAETVSRVNEAQLTLARYKDQIRQLVG